MKHVEVSDSSNFTQIMAVGEKGKYYLLMDWNFLKFGLEEETTALLLQMF